MTFPRGLIIGVIAMTVVVAASNYLVQFPVNDWVTWEPLPIRLPFW